MSRTWKQLWRETCRGTLPAYRVLVPDSVPESVLRTWLARGYRVSAASPVAPFVSPGMSRNLIRTNVAYRSTTALGVTATGIAALPTAIITMATGDIATGGVVTTGIFAGLTALTSGWTGLRFRRDPKRLSTKDKEAAARARWITPSDLGWVAGVQHGQDTDEQRLFHLAVVTARRITQTRAWTHPILQDHVARVDLDHAVASIGSRLVELVELRNELEAIREEHTTKRIDAYLSKLATAFQSMSARVMAMYDYYEHLVDLDRQLRILEHTEASKAIGERVLDVLSRTADDESADWRFRELNIEAESHADVIRDLLDELEETAEGFDDLDDLDRRLADAQSKVDTRTSIGSHRDTGSHRDSGDRPGAAQGNGAGVRSDDGAHARGESGTTVRGRVDSGAMDRESLRAIESGDERDADIFAELRRQVEDHRGPRG